jgi:hypothetical protein
MLFDGPYPTIPMHQLPGFGFIGRHIFFALIRLFFLQVPHLNSRPRLQLHAR